MGTFLSVLVVAAGFAGILGALAWLGAWVRRRGAGGALMNPIDEVFHPSAKRFRHEVETYEERVIQKETH